MTAETSIINIQLMGCLEETIDKLQISGQVMPLTYEMRKNAKMLLDENISYIKETQADLEKKFADALISEDGSIQEKERLAKITQNLKAAAHAFNRAFKQNPLGDDMFQKIELERLFLETTLSNMMAELNASGEFSSLKVCVRVEKNNKVEFQDIIKREEASRKRIKELQRSLIDIKSEKEIEVQKRNELIAHLKDRLQELKAKTNMEAKYVKKSTDNSLSQTKKRCDLTEGEMKQQIDKYNEQLDEENRVNTELESYLKTAIVRLKQQTDHWSEKSDKETLQKQVDLDNLKTRRAKDLEKYQNLAKLYTEYEKVVIEDHFEKDKDRRKAEQEKYELESSIKIQSWWRSQLLRHKLGPHGKKKKGKKGKGKKKK